MAIWVSGDLGVLQGPLDIDVLDPDTGMRRAAPHVPLGGGARHAARGPRDRGARRGAIARRPVRAGDPLRQPSKPGGRCRSTMPSSASSRDRRAQPAPRALHGRRARHLGGLPVPAALRLRSRRRSARTSTPRSARSGSTRAASPWCRASSIRRSASATAARMRGAQHTFLIGLGNDEIGYQVPTEKWDDSCHACAPLHARGRRRAVPDSSRTSTATRCSRTTWARRWIRA